MLDVGLVGKRIRDLRKGKGLTQNAFADELHVSFQAVSNWERGIAPPELENLIRIAPYFGVLVDDLLRSASERLVLGIDGGGAALDELKSYVISRLLWDPDTDVELEIKRFCKAVFGKAGEKMEEYTRLAMKACESAPLTIYQNPDAEYITDGFIEKADELFSEAMAFAETEEIRKRVEREYLSVRFLKIARTPLDAAGL